VRQVVNNIVQFYIDGLASQFSEAYLPAHYSSDIRKMMAQSGDALFRKSSRFRILCNKHSHERDAIGKRRLLRLRYKISMRIKGF